MAASELRSKMEMSSESNKPPSDVVVGVVSSSDDVNLFNMGDSWDFAGEGSLIVVRGFSVGGCAREGGRLRPGVKKCGMTDCVGGPGGGTVLVMATSGMSGGLSIVMRRARDTGSCQNGGGPGKELSHSPTMGAYSSSVTIGWTHGLGQLLGPASRSSRSSSVVRRLMLGPAMSSWATSTARRFLGIVVEGEFSGMIRLMAIV